MIENFDLWDWIVVIGLLLAVVIVLIFIWAALYRAAVADDIADDIMEQEQWRRMGEDELEQWLDDTVRAFEKDPEQDRKWREYILSIWFGTHDDEDE